MMTRRQSSLCYYHRYSWAQQLVYVTTVSLEMLMTVRALSSFATEERFVQSRCFWVCVRVSDQAELVFRV
jgi:hypothetical protein